MTTDVRELRKRLNIKPDRKDKELDTNVKNGQLWSPLATWKCLCCQDTGVILPRLSEIVVDGYDKHNDRPLQCNHTRNCIDKVPNGWDEYNVNRNISQEVCRKLHLYERENWEEWMKEDYQKTLRRAELIKRGISDIGKYIKENPSETLPHNYG